MLSGYVGLSSFPSSPSSGQAKIRMKTGMEWKKELRQQWLESQRGRNTTVSLKCPKQNQKPFRYVSSAPSTLGGVVLSRKRTQLTRSLFASKRKATENKHNISPWRAEDCVLPTPNLPRYLLMHMYTHLCPGILQKKKKGWKNSQTIPVQQSGKCSMLRWSRVHEMNTCSWDEQPSTRQKLEKTVSIKAHIILGIKTNSRQWSYIWDMGN